MMTAPTPGFGSPGSTALQPRSPPNNALLAVQTNDQVDAERDAIAAAQQQAANPVIVSLSAYVKACFERAKRAREETGMELKWLEYLRQRKGEYDASKLQAIREMGGSDVFWKLTEEKCAGAEAWLLDTLAPSDDKAWTLSPTEIPSLPEPVVQSVIQELMAQVAQDIAMNGGPIDYGLVFQTAAQRAEERLAMIREEAKVRAQRMEDTIEDQMQEGDFAKVFEDGIYDLVTLGTMIIKGPCIHVERRMVYVQGQPTIIMQPVIRFWRVSPFDYYPAPNIADINDGYGIERIRYTRRDLIGMKGLEGVNDALIDAALLEYGSRGLRTEQLPDAERRRLADQSHTMNNDDAIEGYEFNGSVPGTLLAEWGMQGVEPTAEYDISAVLVGSYVVRVSLNYNLLGKKPYSKAVFEPVIGSFWGVGVPGLMDDLQKIINAACRSLVDNMGMCSGPQAVINDINSLAAGEDISTIYPRKIWQFVDKTMGGRSVKPLEFFTIDSQAERLMNIIQFVTRFADTRTRIPAYSYGSDQVAGAGKTMGGLSMLMNAANRNIKKIIAGIDRDLVYEIIERMFVFNMIFHPDTGIKGDVEIVPKGALSLAIREQRSLRILDLLARTANPIDSAIIGPTERRNALEEVARDMDLPPGKIIPDERTMMQRLNAQAEAAATQAQQQAQGKPGQGEAP